MGQECRIVVYRQTGGRLEKCWLGIVGLTTDRSQALVETSLLAARRHRDAVTEDGTRAEIEITQG